MSVVNTVHPDKPTTTEMRIHHNSMIDASKAAVLHERTTTEASKDTAEPLLVVTDRQRVPVLRATKALPALTEVSSAATTSMVDVDSEVEHSSIVAPQTDDLPVPTIEASSIPIALPSGEARTASLIPMECTSVSSGEGAKSVLSDDKVYVLSYIADVPKEKDHELPDSKDEESISD